MIQVHLKIEDEARAATASARNSSDVSEGDEPEKKTAASPSDGRLSALEKELAKARERADRLEALVEAMGVHRGFALEFVLSSVCPHHALRAVAQSPTAHH
jgi:hypothetical protein